MSKESKIEKEVLNSLVSCFQSRAEGPVDMRLEKVESKKGGSVLYFKAYEPESVRDFVCYPDDFDSRIRQIEEEYGVVIKVNDHLVDRTESVA
jgi:hypothetical protein